MKVTEMLKPFAKFPYIPMRGTVLCVEAIKDITKEALNSLKGHTIEFEGKLHLIEDIEGGREVNRETGTLPKGGQVGLIVKEVGKQIRTIAIDWDSTLTILNALEQYADSCEDCNQKSEIHHLIGAINDSKSVGIDMNLLLRFTPESYQETITDLSKKVG